MEALKMILTNYGPSVVAVIIVIVSFFWNKKILFGNEQKLKDDITMLIRENAELKVQLKKAMETINNNVDTLNKKVNELMEESEEDVKNN